MAEVRVDVTATTTATTAAAAAAGDLPRTSHGQAGNGTVMGGLASLANMTSSRTFPSPDLEGQAGSNDGKLAAAVRRELGELRQSSGTDHPSGKEKSSVAAQVLRIALFAVYFTSSASSIVMTQLIGAPLYWVSREHYYAYMSFTKQLFALVSTTMTTLWGPTLIRISADPSLAHQIHRTSDGLVKFEFPQRIVLIANHQIYTDWLYLWWVAYANSPGMHGYLYIILKESLKYIPLLGTGMMFYGFIFMSRKKAVDEPRLAHRIAKVSVSRLTKTGKSILNPMWLLLFPEGTNLSTNGREKSAQWAEKNGIRDPQHVMLPRSTGMLFCLRELKGTVEYVYDCTMAYEGIPRGNYGEEFFSLTSIYFQGRPPKSVNFYWRRFPVADIPLHDQTEFDTWLRARWDEKDALLEHYASNGRFPPSKSSNADSGAVADIKHAGKCKEEDGWDEQGYIETEVRTRWPWEFLQAFVVPGLFLYLCLLLKRTYAG